ncbi:MAG TPA: hypothetical protein VLG66_10855 [Alphaproteobacteria bacterium]|nr:hypothetical protein [Methyloceanibacter sp.]HSE78493.1 hypothetical protein [Alphaproteobacteria bacterium]
MIVANSPVRLQLFGGFALVGDAAPPVQVSLRRAQGLLAYLALQDWRGETRE